ncbi:peptidoglycan-binding protein LysM [Lutimonas halocynthiae]|uniref:peptidoglycan-binding protein LysM n=1 Tax=Lutimonas halocynthiae TaxID=1446477 RepID=UPI0025B329C0|nr:peptidoglycan-binding protein LysM [Lutimonas halocynthiae]MDN3641956.1 peptidoglycan-binding protein LysM [Lutimonas halocynthiae]
MGLISFLKGAGEKVFGKSDETLEKEKAEAIVKHINKYGLNVKDLAVTVEGETVTLNGEVSSVLERNRVVVVTGNVAGISSVNDNLVLNVPEPEVVEPEKQYYTVVSGDYLSKISKRVYGDAMKYNIIFEANKPMLTDPDKIYPGQVLVIPAL